MALKLFRRHGKVCSKHYPTQARLYRPRTKAEVAKDCRCAISAEGTLRVRGYITNKATGTASWDDAEKTAAEWLKWGDFVPHAPEEKKNSDIQYAIDSFLASIGPHGRNVDPTTVKKFEILLQQRLLPFAQHRGYTLIGNFDDLDAVTKFVESWRNLNPHRNKKVDGPLPLKPLANSTKRADLERFRAFLRYCEERAWLATNQAKKIRFKSKVEKKFGFEPDEEERVFRAIDSVDDGRGRTGQYNAQELRVFCLVMRHAGLRISDATTLNDKQLVKRQSGKGWAFRVYQQKTEEWVYVPIPDFVEQELGELQVKGRRDGRNYWFWTCEGAIDTAVTNWRERVTRLLALAEREQKFLHAATPHTFRHTFSIRHLNAGTDIKFVSRWLRHASILTTEKHYAHAVKGTMIASEEAYDRSIACQLN